MTQSLPPALCEMIQQSCLELAVGLGMGTLAPLAAERGASIMAGLSHAAVIGFTGDSLKGSLVVAAPAAFLAKTHPNVAMEMPVGDEEMRDWVGELANQILGRFKNKMVETGHPFNLGMPTLMTSKDLQVAAPKDASRGEFFFEGENGPLSLFMEATLAPGVQFGEGKAKNQASLGEGGGMLF